jgi:hypothetical protein
LKQPRAAPSTGLGSSPIPTRRNSRSPVGSSRPCEPTLRGIVSVLSMLQHLGTR